MRTKLLLMAGITGVCWMVATTIFVMVTADDFHIANKDLDADGIEDRIDPIISMAGWRWSTRPSHVLVNAEWFGADPDFRLNDVGYVDMNVDDFETVFGPL